MSGIAMLRLSVRSKTRSMFALTISDHIIMQSLLALIVCVEDIHRGCDGHRKYSINSIHDNLLETEIKLINEII